MDFEMWTLGDVTYLWNIFNSLAAMTNGSSMDDVGGLLRVGLAIGVLIVFFKSLLQGGRGFNIAPFLISITLVLGLYLPKANQLTINDVYTSGAVFKPVNNVPLGVAMLAEVSSTVGYKFLQWYEQAFSLPTSSSFKLAGNGYISGFEVISGVSKFTFDKNNYPISNSLGGNGDFALSLKNYIVE